MDEIIGTNSLCLQGLQKEDSRDNQVRKEDPQKTVFKVSKFNQWRQRKKTAMYELFPGGLDWVNKGMNCNRNKTRISYKTAVNKSL